MGDPKPLRVLWSKAAVIAAGSNLVSMQAKLVEEVAEIVPDAQGWFLHTLPRDADDVCYRCTGHAFEDEWQVLVQIASYEPMPPFPDDHPGPERRSKGFKFAELIQGPDNEVFAAYEDLIAE